MSGKESFPRGILLVRRKSSDLVLSLPLFLDRVISLIRNGDARKLVFSFLARIQSEDLILLILVQTQVPMIFDGSVRKLVRSPDEAALFGALFAHEQHSGGIPAIRPG